MKEYTAYHVVTERPMTVGQVLCLDETYPSGVYRRVMEKVPLVEEIYQNPGAWAGKPLEHHTMVALRELALEQVRREQFPQHPSRLHCLYVSETREEAQQWASFFASLGRPDTDPVFLSPPLQTQSQRTPDLPGPLPHISEFFLPVQERPYRLRQ